ncbi:T9SS type A sorting domain-containing protein [uncultured Flavobacterium sp.]|uniref:T9SS type A sorting domain-containing protein n=1 Tax=uncultured Flavobacterium sp. TaxID=165435 RepID=UPI0030EEB55C|tara:strand:- start:64752 stop:68147 length:3396 start_codon:yes stop_codon:yes gene_type:complete
MKKTITLFTMLISLLGYSQYNSSAPWLVNKEEAKQGNLTIEQLKSSFDAYWLTHDKNKKGSGYKPFMRWEYHWQNKVDVNGNIITPEEMWAAFNQKKTATINKNTQSLPVSNWQPVGPFSHLNTGSWSSGQGRVNIVHVDPSNSNTIYIGTPAGGIWKSIDSGTTWTALSDNLPQIGVSGIAIDYSNSNTIYIATGDKDSSDTYSIGVLKSIDGGLTWNTTGLTFTNTSTLAGDILIHPTNNQILWCGTSVGLYRTTNAGLNWTVVQTGNFSQGSLRLKPNDPTTVYAVSNNRFFKSTNTGSTFSVITTSLPFNSGRMLLDVTAANSNYIYILSTLTGGDFQGIYRSMDGGSSWTKTSGTTDVFDGSGQSYYDLALAVSDVNENEIYTGCLNVWKSSNGGSTFSKLNNWSSPFGASYTHADIHYLGFQGGKLYCGSDGGVYVSNNGGIVFTDKTAGAQISQFYKVAVSKQTSANIVGGLQDNGGHAFSDGAWKNYYGADGMDAAISPINQNLYYGFIQNGGNMYISSNAGNSLGSSVSSPTGVSGNWVTPLMINSIGEVFSGFNGLYKLNGSTWTLQNTNSVGSGNLELIAIDPSNDNIMYVTNGSSLYKSTDKGITFTTTYVAPGTIRAIDIHSTNSSIIYLTTSGNFGQALKSTNGGTSFTNFSTGLPNIGKNTIVHQGRNTDNPLYLGTSLGVYYIDDTMTAWEAFDTNLPNVSVTDLEINLEDNMLTAATYGRGIWQTNIPIQVPATDIKLVAIQNPNNIDINCGNSIVPQIQVENNGTNAITVININYSIDGSANTFTWNGNITSGQTALVSLPSQTLSRGVHNMSITSTTPNDAYSDNNSGLITFYVNDSGVVGQTNAFTNTSDELITYNEGSAGSQWVTGTRGFGPMSSGGNTVYTTNLTGNYPDAVKSYIVSQCYNLTNITNPQIQFTMKYHLEENWDIVYVEYSTNFGQTWSLLGQQGPNWYNSNRTNASSGSADDCQNCPGGQWTGTNTTLTTYSYPLNALNNEQNVIFRIVFHSDAAENQLGVNVDDFVISGVLSKANFELKNISVYPNPSEGIFNISLGDIEPTSIEVYDLTGKIILSKKDLLISNFETSINLSDASQGIYFVKINANNQNIVKRIIKQ